MGVNTLKPTVSEYVGLSLFSCWEAASEKKAQSFLEEGRLLGEVRCRVPL